jgi:hypothetical protein
MHRRVWRAGVVGLAVARVALVPAGARAQEHRLELEWTAPPACPSRADVLQTIDELLGRSSGAALEAPLKVRARIEGLDQAWTVELWWRDSRVEQTRRLQATSCTELARAAALVVVFAIDPTGEALGTPAPETPASPAENETTPPVAERTAVDRTPATAPAPPAPAQKSTLSMLAPADRKPTDDSDERRVEGRLLWFGRAQAAFDFGALPSTGVGATAGAGVQRGRFLGAVDFSLFYPQEVGRAEAQGGGRFWMAGASLEPCYVIALQDTALKVCAAGRLEVISARGRGLVVEEDGVAWFPRFGLGAEVGHPLTSNLGLLAGVRPLLAPARPTFVIDDGLIHEPDFLSVLCTAGVQIGPF